MPCLRRSTTEAWKAVDIGRGAAYHRFPAGAISPRISPISLQLGGAARGRLMQARGSEVSWVRDEREDDSEGTRNAARRPGPRASLDRARRGPGLRGRDPPPRGL